MRYVVVMKHQNPYVSCVSTTKDRVREITAYAKEMGIALDLFLMDWRRVHFVVENETAMILLKMRFADYFDVMCDMKMRLA